MAKKSPSDNYTQGYVIFILALVIGLLINISASIIYEMFLKDNIPAEMVVLFLTLLSFGGLIYAYHSRFHEPLVKFLQEFG
ncbi:hypothetical protein A3G67_02205 [Candidatus Roizmanbacteria bacterium RIFCSPLOWO2_12_FULL_40_12]|uniref:Uncharacterized protein n=1 Tax=Candidatus Roizmanbacteria bacterium RIFCSPLOWO2_01_FULL_40_42 TaxID=1802066 RepID=A0A1F7J3S0_9BACT|nr:MAG: hypothetical protein A2779_01410 [Candidatus Roizmanbacteria bacterium RIFCSPHIGHO2_01_FULL_40_98]OGK29017.1 MAG: hypothetical protein A3C31_02050 [Candidatus Roizmanbacteria bacterium RIFCSPHIGHO2_02_FULL_40_53]OGK29986.1 MAG: hypothetical protein A2W49_00160 [Candidatus Roizmanbacteria bacterium RIFCSPHIGHO2_12_41_18]OGK37305.1 MAG: hypothetical protein A3E69_04350 [Candidatus Roizmanbacteria bacterium RIFCSPHIGHO2_12_FULL_40_130]OGK50247.1 MAG: hypothetical protein A3B50_00505 [Candi